MIGLRRPRSRVVRADVADALGEAAAIREAARADGFKRGREEGLAAASEALAAARAEAGRKIDRAATDLARIAVHVAGAVLDAEIQTRPDLVRAVVERALTRARRGRRLVLRVHPDDVAQLGDLRLAPEIEIVADPAIRRGGCLLRDGRMTIDATIETQLDAFRRALATPR